MFLMTYEARRSSAGRRVPELDLGTASPAAGGRGAFRARRRACALPADVRVRCLVVSAARLRMERESTDFIQYYV